MKWFLYRAIVRLSTDFVSREVEMHYVWDSPLFALHLCNLRSFQNIQFYEKEIVIESLHFCVQLKNGYVL